MFEVGRSTFNLLKHHPALRLSRNSPAFHQRRERPLRISGNLIEQATRNARGLATALLPMLHQLRRHANQISEELLADRQPVSQRLDRPCSASEALAAVPAAR
jgi:hypothetical protein